MKIETVTDYALPCMLAENALKEAHQQMLNNQHDQALDQCVTALTQIANMMAAIKYDQAKNAKS